MASRVDALVKPELLLWARKDSRLSIEEAAKKIDVAVDRLCQWESGELRPTIPQLRKLASVYKRPLAVFYLPEPPKTFDAMHDFRRLPDGVDDVISPGLSIEIRRAMARREIAIELARQLGEPNIELALRVDARESAEIVADQIRDYLAISIQTQFSWSDQYNALNSWRMALEDVGVLVFQTAHLPLDDMRGMSISEDILPCIIVNGQDSPRGRVFTLLHEFAHLSLRNGGICDLHETTMRRPTQTDAMEVYCNRVAGAVLVPSASLLQEPLVRRSSGLRDWSDEDVASLADKYWVSREVILRKLVLIGAASEDFYARKREEFEEAYRQRREMQKLNKDSGHPPHYRMVVQRNGIRYTRMVLEAYYEDRITARDVSDFLDVRLKHLGAIERTLFPTAAATGS